MKLTFPTGILLATLLHAAGLALADDVCPEGTLYTVPQCCKLDIAGVASLGCRTPHSTPESPEDLRDICKAMSNSSQKKRLSFKPVCCTVPIAGQGVLCTPAIGKEVEKIKSRC